jgi:hypothetical protein
MGYEEKPAKAAAPAAGPAPEPEPEPEAVAEGPEGGDTTPATEV